MGYKSEFDALAGFFSSGWVVVTSAGPPVGYATRTPICWPNVPFAPPDGTPWVRFNLIDGEARHASSGAPGANVVRHVGIVRIQVFVPTAQGEGTVRTLGDHVATLFRGASFAGYRFSPPYLEPAPSGVADGWYQMNVTIPFSRDEYL